jgi:hypothetical protein
MRLPLVAAVVVVILIAAAGIYRLGSSARERATTAQLADSVRALRVASDACGTELHHEEAELGRFRERLDSMHTHVRGFETDERGVPAARYGEYLGALAEYQDSTDVWEDRVTAVQEMLTRCRDLAGSHNEMVEELLIRQTPP